MTVAAVFLFDSAADALAEVDGRPAARRMVEAAWAGGATPLVVVARDLDGRLASALTGSPAVLAEPAPDAGGVAAQVARGMRVATEQVRDTEGALAWPGRMARVDAETVTTMIEAYGLARGAIVRPRYDDQAGWPVLLPVELLRAVSELGPQLALDRLVDELVANGAGLREVDTGDPSVTHDLETPLEALPPFEGPPDPVKQPPEWGAMAADMGDEGPLQGPHLAPYTQASQEGD